MNSIELNAAIAALATSLSKCLSREEITWWGIVFTQLGANLSTISALNDLCEGEDGSTLGTGASQAVQLTNLSTPS